MRICITTVYNSENCGSYWQARILGEYLKSQGNDVVYLRRSKKGTSHGNKYLMLKVINAIKSLRFKSVVSIFKQYKIFEECGKEFSIIPAIDESIDVNVLGSDTIWNLMSSYFARNHKVFLGGDFIAKKTISYAASVANTDESTLDKYKVDAYLQKIDCLSVRDYYSRQVLGSRTTKDIQVVCDPTMLFNKDFYRSLFPDNKNYTDMVFVYYFGKVPDQLQQYIYKYAEEKKKKICVMGDSMKGDIVYSVYSPQQFLKCFLYADFIVTNTFHGTIFSVNFEKQALFNSDNKKKVDDLLVRFDLCDHDYAKDKNEDLLYSEIDYTKVNKRVDEFRNISKNYINDALGII